MRRSGMRIIMQKLILRRTGILLLLFGIVWLTAKQLAKEPETSLTAKQTKEALAGQIAWDEFSKADPASLLRELSEEDGGEGLTFPEDAEIVYYASDYLMDVREFLAVKSADRERLSQLADCLLARAGQRAEAYAAYEPEQSRYLSQAVCRVEQGMLFYFVGEDAPEAEKLFEQLLKNAEEDNSVKN